MDLDAGCAGRTGRAPRKCTLLMGPEAPSHIHCTQFSTFYGCISILELHGRL